MENPKPHRIRLAIACLRISSFLYFMLGAASFVLFTVSGGNVSSLVLGLFSFLFCFVLVAGIEIVINGLKRRKYWAWIAGLVIFGMYAPSLFLPLGVFGLIALLDQGSVQAFRVQTPQDRDNADRTTR